MSRGVSPWGRELLQCKTFYIKVIILQNCFLKRLLGTALCTVWARAASDSGTPPCATPPTLQLRHSSVVMSPPPDSINSSATLSCGPPDVASGALDTQAVPILGIDWCAAAGDSSEFPTQMSGHRSSMPSAGLCTPRQQFSSENSKLFSAKCGRKHTFSRMAHGALARSTRPSSRLLPSNRFVQGGEQLMLGSRLAMAHGG